MNPTPAASPVPPRGGVWCLPQVAGRGAGLGNELVPWARAWLMAQVLGGRCLMPAFGLNTRGYHRLFGSSRADWLLQRALRGALPVVHFGEPEYGAHRAPDDPCAMRAFERFAQVRGLHGRRPLLVGTEGMWGGLVHVRRAFGFVRGTLLASRGTAPALAALQATQDPARLTVAMHVRRGDFSAAPVTAAETTGTADTPATVWRGRFNTALPLSWFVHVARALRATFGPAVQVRLFSDGRADELAPLVQALGDTLLPRVPGTDASELLAMADADLLVCSVSAYSLWAAALSSAPYLWFEPQLQVHAGGWRSLWGHEPAQMAEGGATAQALAEQQGADPVAGRGHPLAEGDALPGPLVARLQRRLADRRACGDLVFSGVVQTPGAAQAVASAASPRAR